MAASTPQSQFARNSGRPKPRPWRERLLDRVWQWPWLIHALNGRSLAQRALLRAVDCNDPERVEAWLRRGGKPTDRVGSLALTRVLLKRAERTHALNDERFLRSDERQCDALIQAGCTLEDLNPLLPLMLKGHHGLVLKALPRNRLTVSSASTLFLHWMEILALSPLHSMEKIFSLEEQARVLNRCLDAIVIDVFATPEGSSVLLSQPPTPLLSPWRMACLYAPASVLERLLAMAGQAPQTQECRGLALRLRPDDLPRPAFFEQLETGGVRWDEIGLPLTNRRLADAIEHARACGMARQLDASVRRSDEAANTRESHPAMRL